MFVSFFAAVAVVLFAHHLYVFCLRKRLNRRKGGTDVFGEHYVKALHEVVFDDVFISAEARRCREISGISQAQARRAGGGASPCATKALPNRRGKFR